MTHKQACRRRCTACARGRRRAEIDADCATFARSSPGLLLTGRKRGSWKERVMSVAPRRGVRHVILFGASRRGRRGAVRSSVQGRADRHRALALLLRCQPECLGVAALCCAAGAAVASWGRSAHAPDGSAGGLHALPGLWGRPCRRARLNGPQLVCTAVRDLCGGGCGCRLVIACVPVRM